MILLVSLFKSNTDRHGELSYCITQNCLLPQIEKVYVFLENIEESELNKDGFNVPYNEKINFVKISQRPTFKIFVDFANSNLIGKICIIANTDILFDNSLDLVNHIDLNNKMLATTRYNLEGNNLVLQGGGTQGSQDSWIFKSPIKQFNSDIMMGIDGCDSYFAQKVSEAGINVINPCYSLKTIHHHTCGGRNSIINGFCYWSVPDYGSVCVQPSGI